MKTDRVNVLLACVVGLTLSSVELSDAQTTPPADAATPELPWRSEGAKFCPNLQQLLGTAKNNFEDIKGRAESDGWIPRVGMVGMADCTIEKLSPPQLFYTCTPFIDRNKDPKLLRAAYVALRGDLQKCLGESWLRSERPRDGGRVAIKFQHPDLLPTVEVREVHGSRSYFLAFDINGPEPR